MKNYELSALIRAEKFGIVEYTVIENMMVHREVWATEGLYEYTFNLDTMENEKTELIEKHIY